MLLGNEPRSGLSVGNLFTPKSVNRRQENLVIKQLPKDFGCCPKTKRVDRSRRVQYYK
ncbi:MAG: hypothetical protein ACOYKN_12115 [Pirellula sp.]